jgi:hypothetical protein
MIRLFAGFDPREAIAFHAFTNSVLQHATVPVAITALTEAALGDQQRDGSNAFTYARFLVPSLCDFDGWAIFADGDMIVDRDLEELWGCRTEGYAVQVVKHEYRTKHSVKYRGSTLQCPNTSYPRKNWSSVILWNCGHPSNRVLTKDYVSGMTGAHLHRFQWLKDEEIGSLFPTWNHLVDEDPPGEAALRHYTLGVPGIKYYADTYASWRWHSALLKALECAGEDPVSVVKRAQDRIGAVDGIRQLRRV